jgi:PAS domain S-box-containing protein
MKRSLRNLPIKHKLVAVTMAISGVALLLACAAFAIYEQTAFRRTMARDFAILADMFDDNVASGLAFNDPGSIEQTLKTLSANQHIVAACVFDKQGLVIGAYRRPGSAVGDVFKFPAAQSTGQRFGADQLDTFKDIELAGEVIGVVYIGADLGELRERAWRYTVIVGLLLIGCSLVALVLASRLQRIISQPIVDLAHTVATVTSERNYAARAHKQSDDELGRLIDGFNEMLAQIQARDTALQNARDKLEERVEERTGELQKENAERKRAEAELANSLSVLHATLESTADGILVVDQNGRLTTFNRKFAEMWRIPSEVLASHDDAQVMGAVLAQLKDPDGFVRKVQELYAQPDAESFDLLDFKDGRIFERYSQTQRVEGISTGRVWCFRDITERKQAENALRESNEKFNQLADNITDTFWIRSPDMHEVQYISPAFERIWGRSVESMYANPQQWSDFILPEDRDRVRTAFDALKGDAASLDIEYRIVRPDGEVRWVHVRGFQVRDSADKLIRHIGIVTEITAWKQTQAALEKAHAELLDISRQAGMAEVATSVLHNVGNVLNSVNVSATLVLDEVRNSKISVVAQLSALLREHQTDLGSFLTSDPRGRRVPAFLQTLADELATEQSIVIREVELLRKNIEHIKEIVAMQQNYARISGVTEIVAVAELVEDAVQMNASALQRHGVALTRDYRDRPTITVEKHKVLQILVNLIRNAKYACAESGREDKQIAFEITGDERLVRIKVSDNGVGIPPENLTRIFAHGFSTRAAGHGFGLHNGALTAQELGGALIAQSEGPGKGAIFILELPLQPEAQAAAISNRKQ